MCNVLFGLAKTYSSTSYAMLTKDVVTSLRLASYTICMMGSLLLRKAKFLSFLSGNYSKLSDHGAPPNHFINGWNVAFNSIRLEFELIMTVSAIASESWAFTWSQRCM